MEMNPGPLNMLPARFKFRRWCLYACVQTFVEDAFVSMLTVCFIKSCFILLVLCRVPNKCRSIITVIISNKVIVVSVLEKTMKEIHVFVLWTIVLVKLAMINV